MKILEFHRSGNPVLVNVDKAQFINKDCEIYFDNGWILVDESYEDIKKSIFGEENENQLMSTEKLKELLKYNQHPILYANSTLNNTTQEKEEH